MGFCLFVYFDRVSIALADLEIAMKTRLYSNFRSF